MNRIMNRVALSGLLVILAMQGLTFLSAADMSTDVPESPGLKASQQLIEAVQRKDQRSVKKLLKTEGISVNYQDQAGNTALMIACHRGNLALVNALILPETQFTLQNEEKYTAAALACRGGHTAVVRALLKAGDTFLVQGHLDEHPLITAIHKEHSDMIQLILQARPSLVNLRGQYNQGTPLMEAPTVEISRMLVAAGADINAQDKSGYTALMVACMTKRTKIVAYLLQQQGIDVANRNTFDQNAFTIAQERDFSEIMDLLNKYEEEHEVMIKPASKRARIEETDDEQ